MRLDELSRFIPILHKVELDESIKGLDELAHVIMTMSSNETRRVRVMTRRVKSTQIVDFDLDIHFDQG